MGIRKVWSTKSKQTKWRFPRCPRTVQMLLLSSIVASISKGSEVFVLDGAPSKWVFKTGTLVILMWLLVTM